MPVVEVIGVLLLVGILLWGIGEFPYINAGMKKLIQIVVVVVAAVWVVSLFFPVGHLGALRLR